MKTVALATTVFCALTACSGGGGGGGSEGGSTESGGGSSGGSFNDFSLSACATRDLKGDQLEQLAQLFSDFKVSRGFRVSRTEPYQPIKVVFHVISKGPSYDEGEVPDSMILAQIDAMNAAYSGQSGGIPTPFRFELGGIDRVRNPDWFTIAPGSQTELDVKSALHTGGLETMNVYTSNIDGGILGYSMFPILGLLAPEIDGIVMHYKGFPGGPLEHYRKGHVLVHEAGHWLGLLHTFQGECSSSFGDLVSDTPQEMQPDGENACPVGRDSCPDLDGLDPVHNHMTYTDDECRSEFTPEQLQLMSLNVELFRGLQ